MSIKKRFFASHAKSSAAVVSLAIHAVFLLIAITFVAVKVIQKDDQNFEAKPITRPKMQLKKLQVPVSVKKKRPKPKLRKRIVAKPRNQTMPDIKMPEITGIKGGIGNANGSGLGGAASVGFSMPEIEIFGVKGKGEKILLALNADTDMMLDERGGIPAYTIIKDELIRIVGELPSTALFNVIIFDTKNSSMAFPQLVSATDANAAKLKEWLEPLNAVRKNMNDRDFGMHTLGSGGTAGAVDLREGKFKDIKKVNGTGNVDLRNWYYPAMLAQKMQADTIFILTEAWDLQRVATSGKEMSREEWDKTSPGKKWNAAYKKALQLVKEENAKRRAAGQAPKAIGLDEWSLKPEYYPDLEKPPEPGWYSYTPRDFAEAFLLIREKYASKNVQIRSGVGKKKNSRKINFSFNVIQFVPKGEDTKGWMRSDEKFTELTSICKGDFKTIKGMDGVQSYASKDAVVDVK